MRRDRNLALQCLPSFAMTVVAGVLVCGLAGCSRDNEASHMSSAAESVTQPANPDGAGRVSGFKLLIPAAGDFEFQLRCAIRRLDQPTK